MATKSSDSPLIQQVRAGTNHQLTLMAAKGMVPLAPEELIPLQVELYRSSDKEISETARTALLELSPSVLEPYLANDAGRAELRFFSRETDNPRILLAIIRRRGAGSDILEEMAPRLGPDLQEALLVRQDAIIQRPSILRAMESNPQITTYARRRIEEYRLHLLKEEVVPEPEAPEPAVAPVEPEPEKEVPTAAPEPGPEPGPEEDGDEAKIDGLNEAQIRVMPVPTRLELARGANRPLRAILIRDTNSKVALAVIKDNPLSDQEVAQYAGSRTVCEDVLEEIARRREWMRKYVIQKALVANPRTPTGISIRLVPQMTVRDLKELTRDRNIPDAVRTRAQQLYKIKTR